VIDKGSRLVHHTLRVYIKQTKQIYWSSQNNSRFQSRPQDCWNLHSCHAFTTIKQ
jgi:hypothetical protein